MLKLGEYCEEDAKLISKHLKNAGMKVELKAFIDSSIETKYYLLGRLSELKGKTENIDEFERYFRVAQSLLDKGVKPEEFEEKFLLEIDPLMSEKRSLLTGQIEEFKKNHEANSDDDDEERPLTDILLRLKEILEASKIIDFVDDAFQRNDIKIEESSVQIEDPLLRIPVSSVGSIPDSSLSRSTLSLNLEKTYGVYIDEFSAALEEEIEDDFREAFPDECLKIMAMGFLMKDMVEEPGRGKTEIDDFAERCQMQFEKNGNQLDIDGRDVAEDLAKILEKNGVLKIKGNIIKWKA
ncbi:MAG: hypothetical protein HPY61_05655 [Methanotrichaceae archaeon]|nr:hypothetical protein [Methanotrichaceae archaeon]